MGSLAAVSTVPILARAATTVDEDAFIDSLSTLILVKKIIEPTKKFIYLQAYDNARTNIRYTLNQLFLQKKVDLLIKSSIDFSDDMDSIDAAQDAGSKLTNTLLQFDNTAYTCIFIPSDDGTVPPSADKYRKQANDFYDTALSSIDVILKVANERQIAAATKLADAATKTLPPVLFKDVKAKPKTAPERM